jgi:hypothetical protein
MAGMGQDNIDEFNAALAGELPLSGSLRASRGKPVRSLILGQAGSRPRSRPCPSFLL